jgi:flagellar protein FliS
VEPSADRSYLETEVMTATPQKRHLMLIEAVIRLIHRVRQHWHAEQDEEEQAGQCLDRAQQIITELMSALNHEIDADLTRRVGALYLFVLRRLVDANLHRDEGKLDDALGVLEPQREAWQGVCEKLGSATAAQSDELAASVGGEEPGRQPPPIPPLSADPASAGIPSAGLSLEA